MSQLHFYVPDETETLIRSQAKRLDVSVSQYLASIVKREAANLEQWPKGYFDLFALWEGAFPDRPTQLPLEARQSF